MYQAFDLPRRSAARPPTLSRYPLQKSFLVWGFSVGIFTSALLSSLLAGFAFFVMFAVAGTLWRRGEPPILPFCLGSQWAAVAAGFLYMQVTGSYPGFLGEDVNRAVLYSLVGLLCIAAGIRAGAHFFRGPLSSGDSPKQVPPFFYDIRRLWWIVLILFLPNWVVDVSSLAASFGGGQIVSRLLEFREVFPVMLLLEVIRQRRGYRYAAAGVLVAMIPKFGSYFSSFKDVLFSVFMAVLMEWKPWSKTADDAKRNVRIVSLAVAMFAVFIFLGMLWEGGVKPPWRMAVLSGRVSGSPLSRIKEFPRFVKDAAADLEAQSSIEALIANMSSATAYFSLVLTRVPALMPHEDGAMVMRAVTHVLMPRFLFPDKANLGSDSWLVRRYAGLGAAGEESGTSVGLGYIAQLYIDFGSPVMFVGLFLYGTIVGVGLMSLRIFSPSDKFFHATAMVVFLQHFSALGEIAKQAGGFIQSVIIFSALLYFLGSRLHQILLLRIVRRRSALTRTAHPLQPGLRDAPGS